MWLRFRLRRHHRWRQRSTRRNVVVCRNRVLREIVDDGGLRGCGDVYCIEQQAVVPVASIRLTERGVIVR